MTKNIESPGGLSDSALQQAYLKAESNWNLTADAMNQWEDLGHDEKGLLIARAVIAAVLSQRQFDAGVPVVIELPDRVVDTVAQSSGLSGPFSRNFYDFAQALKDEIVARFPSPATLAQKDDELTECRRAIELDTLMFAAGNKRYADQRALLQVALEQALDCIMIAQSNLGPSRSSLGGYTSLWDRYEASIASLRQASDRPQHATSVQAEAVLSEQSSKQHDVSSHEQ